MSKPFQVLHVIGGSDFGGIVPYVGALVKMARGQGGRAAVVATAPRVVDYFKKRNIEVVNVPDIERPVNPLRDLSGVLRLKHYLSGENFDIVHTHTSKGGFVGRLAARLARTPITIHTTQGYAFADYATRRLDRAFFLQMERMATGWCDIVIAANRADRQLAIDNGIVPETKIVTIPNSLDLSEADESFESSNLRFELGLDPGRRVVGTMARLSPQKGIEYFLDAIPEIRRAYPTAQFVIIGDGPLRRELESRVAHLGIGDSLKFIGFRSDWIQVLRQIDVFVMPSLWEGMPITLLGAMAVSLAIVATSIKGITEVCPPGGNTAKLVPPRDSRSISQAVLAFLENRQMAQSYGHCARRRVEAEFAEPIMQQRTWDLYATLLEKYDRTFSHPVTTGL